MDSSKQTVKIQRITMSENASPESIAEEISKNLMEPNIDLIYGIVSVLGINRTLRYYNMTRTIERQGGLYCADGSRRKTPGGVFFYVVNNDSSTSEYTLCKKKAISAQKMKQNENRRRRNEEIKEQLIREGLLTTSCPQLKTN